MTFNSVDSQSYMDQIWETNGICLLSEPSLFRMPRSGLPGADAHVPKLSFSAALTIPMERAATIVFDKVFVNEGDFYDPRTGRTRKDN